MYNKLFTSILDSSVWLEPTSTRIVWIMFIAAMDEDSFVRMASTLNVAARARVTLQEAEDAIKCLEGPDKHCPEQESEGRRIERVENGWIVINGKKYRELLTREMQRELTRRRVAAHRARKAQKVIGNAAPLHVTKSNASEAEAEAQSKKIDIDMAQREIREIPPMSRATFDELASARAVPKDCADWLWNTCEARGWTDKSGQPILKIEPLLLNAKATWEKNEHQQRNKNNSPNRPRSHDRNAGTCNEGIAHTYKAKPYVPKTGVGFQDVQRPDAGGDAKGNK